MWGENIFKYHMCFLLQSLFLLHHKWQMPSWPLWPYLNKGITNVSFCLVSYDKVCCTQSMCVKSTLLSKQSQKSASLLICSVAEWQIKLFQIYSKYSKSVQRSELNSYSNINLKNNDYWWCKSWRRIWPYTFKSQGIKTSCRIILPLVNSCHSLIILPSCVVTQLQPERTCWRKTET